MVNRLHIVVLAAAIALAGCGKKAETPVKTADQIKAEQDAAAKMVRDNPVYGDQIKALDKAKETAAAADAAVKKTDEELKKAEGSK
jgi:hypothetical protein